jgi:HAD domain in Swiss Army Knife RNA repair proteins
MKVIFLDIDGVLNNRQSWATASQDNDGNKFPIDSACLDQLKRITLACPEAKIVLSSTWRLWDISKEAAKRALADRGMVLAGCTPDLKEKHIRGEEIEQFRKFAHHTNIEQFPLPITRFVILDDDTDMCEWQMPFFVQTTFEHGLTPELADKAIEILLAS